MALFNLWKTPKPPTRKPQPYRFSTVINEARQSRASNYLTLVPFIRLRGLWLQDAGFKIGDEIKIHVEDGKLTITRK
jgi:hypothetical protein